MMKNDVLKQVIISLEKQSKKQKVQIWDRIAQELRAPTRQHRAVNVKKIASLTEKDDAIIVPGKVLATGVITHPVTVVAYQCSESAAVKIKAAGGSVRTLSEEMTKNPKGSALRIIG
ncbi:MAG TPA: 50S ribosomal protein L18e [Acidobacteriota bacterium]|nr:50S ribosomal protein L18e [Acidobacteriota bacterium]